MSMNSEEIKQRRQERVAFAFGTGGVTGAGLLLIGIVLLFLWGCPQYDVYKAEMRGKAEFAQAEQNRQIAGLEAAANIQRAEGQASADVIRARGEAQSNEVIGASLEGQHGERRLRYLMIEAMRTHEGATIYVPTEAGLPITEAGRRPGQ